MGLNPFRKRLVALCIILLLQFKAKLVLHLCQSSAKMSVKINRIVTYKRL